MQQRKSATVNGRPSGTDGSDFSFRMVVDSRYTKVAKGKCRLSKLFFTQAIVQLIGVLTIVLSILKEQSLDTLAVSTTAISYISLIIGELGRRHSRVNFLKFYLIASSTAILMAIASVGRSNFLIAVIQDPSIREAKKVEVLITAGVLLELLVQTILISTTISLIRNMSPPKRAS